MDIILNILDVSKGMGDCMKEKKKSKILPILCFIASVFFAAFVLVEFHNDYLAVGGVGIVMLIAAYFLMSRIEFDIFKKQEIEKQENDMRFQEVYNKIDETSNRIETLQKAIYVATKKGTENIEMKLNDIQKNGIDCNKNNTGN